MENGTEEDVKMREKRIKQLQKDLFEIRKYMEVNAVKINVKSTLEIELA